MLHSEHEHSRSRAQLTGSQCLKNAKKKGEKSTATKAGTKKRAPKAHICYPDQAGPMDEELLEIETLREKEYAVTLDDEERLIFEQVLADEAMAAEVAQYDDDDVPFAVCGQTSLTRQS